VAGACDLGLSEHFWLTAKLIRSPSGYRRMKGSSLGIIVGNVAHDERIRASERAADLPAA
jgi:hypothetical protein